VTIKKGTTFRHRTVTCHSSYGETRQCIVTAVRKGHVYFRFDNQHRGSHCCEIENFNKYAEDIRCPK
jgi:hypothetical protein